MAKNGTTAGYVKPSGFQKGVTGKKGWYLQFPHPRPELSSIEKLIRDVLRVLFGQEFVWELAKRLDGTKHLICWSELTTL